MTSDADPSRLELSPERMRELGHRVIDMIVEHQRAVASRPATARATRPQLERLLREPVPREPSDPLVVLERLQNDVLSHFMHVDHPRFFGFVPSPGNFVSAMGDAIASGLNPFVGTWLVGSGPAEIELVTVDWLRELCGLPEAAGGLFTSGGSAANLVALGVARRRVLDDRLEGAVAYCSDQTHHSLERGLQILGLRREQISVLESDASGRLDLEVLTRAIAADRAADLRPFCVVANAGTTNTGVVDPLPELVGLCRQENLWLHVDGAYGAAAVLCDQGREMLDGLADVDSLSLDPHKWLFQPFEIGCALVREGRWLEETYSLVPDYMQDTDGRDEEVNFAARGLQLSRSFRALKLWMSMKVFGVNGFAAAIERGIRLAELVETIVRESGAWELVTPASLAIVTFRYRPETLGAAPDERIDAINRRIIEQMYADGFAMLSTTSLAGRPVLRMCTINPRTTDQDILATLRRLEQFGKEAAS